MAETEDYSFPKVEGQGFLVSETFSGVHSIHRDYHLLPGDLLQHDEDGSYTKIAPGLAIAHFWLSSEQEAKLKAVRYQAQGLNFHILSDEG